MSTAPFFPPGVDEVAHDSGYEKGQIETVNNQMYPPATSLLPYFPVGPHRQAQLFEDGILHDNKAGYKVTEKAEDNRWV